MSKEFGWTPNDINAQDPATIEGYFLILNILGRKQEQEMKKAQTKQHAASKGRGRRR